MKKKISGWFGIALSIGIIVLAILYSIKGNFIMAIGIPIGIYMIVRCVSDIRGIKTQ